MKIDSGFLWSSITLSTYELSLLGLRYILMLPVIVTANVP